MTNNFGNIITCVIPTDRRGQTPGRVIARRAQGTPFPRDASSTRALRWSDAPAGRCTRPRFEYRRSKLE